MYKKNRFSKIMVAILIVSIVLPMLLLLPWVFTERYVWPELWPSTTSTRAIESILRSQAGFGRLMSSSIVLSVTVAILSVMIAIPGARAIAFYEFKGKNFFYFSQLLPFIIPATVFGMGIQVIFLRMGWGRTFIGVMLAQLIYSLPYASRLILDGTRALGNGLEEQARVLGARPSQAFWHASVPSLSPVILSALSMSFIISFSQYFLTLIIGGGKIQTFATVMVPYLQGGERNIAAVYSLIFVGISITVFAVFEVLISKLYKAEDVQL